MPKSYKDRQMKSDPAPEREYHFPKFQVTIVAKSRAEAEEKLAARNQKEHE